MTDIIITKKFIHDKYESGTTIKNQGKCSECGTDSVVVVNIIAEHNAGELFDVNICRKCLLRYASIIVKEEKDANPRM